MVSVAYVLAAGLGTRLRPLTNERCKPLVEVCGTPLVELTLGLLERAGVKRVAINSHWLHPQLPQALGGRWRSLELHYTHEPAVLGTGGGLRGLAKMLPAPAGEKVLVMNADALIDVDLRALIAADRDDVLATLVLKEVPDVKAYGAIGTGADERITDFAGRAHVGDVMRERMFCGVHLVDPKAFEVLPDVALVPDAAGASSTGAPVAVATGPHSGINDEGYPEWMRRGALLRGFDTRGTFCDVGTAERLLEANLAVLDGTWASAHLQPFARFHERSPGVYVAASAVVDAGAKLVAPVVVDEGAVVAAGAVLAHSVIGKRARIGNKARLTRVVVQSDGAVDEDISDAVAGAKVPLIPVVRTAVDRQGSPR